MSAAQQKTTLPAHDLNNSRPLMWLQGMRSFATEFGPSWRRPCSPRCIKLQQVLHMPLSVHLQSESSGLGHGFSTCRKVLISSRYRIMWFSVSLDISSKGATMHFTTNDRQPQTNRRQQHGTNKILSLNFRVLATGSLANSAPETAEQSHLPSATAQSTELRFEKELKTPVLPGRGFCCNTSKPRRKKAF